MPEHFDSAICIEAERHGDDVVIRPHGRLTEAQSQQLSDEMKAHIEQGARRVIVHLSDVSFLTSSCLGSFMYAHKLGQPKNTKICLAEMQPLVREVVETTRLTKLFPVFDTLQDALAAE